MNEIDEIKSRLNIVDIVKEYVNLKKTGSNYFGLCPFHNEKTPSFSVNEKLQIFKCFGCGEGGDVIKFYMKIKPGITFIECINELASRAGYEIKKFTVLNKNDLDYLTKQKKIIEINNLANIYFKNKFQKIINSTEDNFSYIKDYIIKRGLIDELIINNFGIGFDDGNVKELIDFFQRYKFSVEDLIESSLLIRKQNNILVSKFRNRIVFSIFDHLGKIVGFSGRHVPNSKDKITPPKYINSNDNIVFNKSKVLFGLYQSQPYINQKDAALILCEGQMNVISSFKIGVRNIVASLGTSFTEQQLSLISRYVKNLLIAFDKDKAGNKALIRVLELILKNTDINVKVVHWDKNFGKDPDELIRKDPKLWIDAIQNALMPFDYFLKEFESIKNHDDPNIKHRFLKFIIPLINNYKNPILKQDIFKRISFIFGLDLDGVLSYIDNSNIMLNQYETKYHVFTNNSNTQESDNVYHKLNLMFFAVLIQNWNSLKDFIKNNEIQKNIFQDKFILLFDFLSLHFDATLEEIIQNLEQLDLTLFRELQDLLSYPIDIDQNVISVNFLKKIYKNIAYVKYKMILNEYNKTQNSELLDEAKKLAKILK